VLLIHGLRSDSAMWQDFPLVDPSTTFPLRNELSAPLWSVTEITKDGLPLRLPPYLMFAADYHGLHQNSVAGAAGLVNRQLDELFTQLSGAGLAVAKVDVVAHSMGAPVTRTLDDARRQFGLTPVRRFVSLDGVHLGSQLIDCLLDNRNQILGFQVIGIDLGVTLGQVADLIGFNLDGGAFEDMRTDAARYPTMPDSDVHAVVGSIDRDLIYETTLELFGLALKELASEVAQRIIARLPVAGPIIAAQLEYTDFLDQLSLDFIYGQQFGHDLALSAYSQSGALLGSNCSVFGGRDAVLPPCDRVALEHEARVFGQDFGAKHLVTDGLFHLGFPGRSVTESQAVAERVALLLDRQDPRQLEPERGTFSRGFLQNAPPETLGCRVPVP
jgi:pimeloyl-ACP methyl ester carboxylesterase